jgi:hypothetical protein
MIEKENDAIFEQAAAFYRALRMIQRNADFEQIAKATNFDVRFVIALAVLSASEAVNA